MALQIEPRAFALNYIPVLYLSIIYLCETESSYVVQVGLELTHCVAQGGLKLQQILPQLLKCWDHRCVPPCPTLIFYYETSSCEIVQTGLKPKVFRPQPPRVLFQMCKLCPCCSPTCCPESCNSSGQFVNLQTSPPVLSFQGSRGCSFPRA